MGAAMEGRAMGNSKGLRGVMKYHTWCSKVEAHMTKAGNDPEYVRMVATDPRAKHLWKYDVPPAKAAKLLMG